MSLINRVRTSAATRANSQLFNLARAKVPMPSLANLSNVSRHGMIR